MNPHMLFRKPQRLLSWLRNVMAPLGEALAPRWENAKSETSLVINLAFLSSPDLVCHFFFPYPKWTYICKDEMLFNKIFSIHAACLYLWARHFTNVTTVTSQQSLFSGNLINCCSLLENSVVSWLLNNCGVVAPLLWNIWLSLWCVVCPLISHMKRGEATLLCKDEMEIIHLSPWSVALCRTHTDKLSHSCKSCSSFLPRVFNFLRSCFHFLFTTNFKYVNATRGILVQQILPRRVCESQNTKHLMWSR